MKLGVSEFMENHRILRLVFVFVKDGHFHGKCHGSEIVN